MARGPRRAVPDEARHRRRHHAGRPRRADVDRRRLRRRRPDRAGGVERADLPRRLERRARADRRARRRLRAPAAAARRLLRAQPRRRAHLPAHERRRGAAAARHRRDHDDAAEHPVPRRGDDHPAAPGLAARARRHGRLPHHGHRDAGLPAHLDPHLPGHAQRARRRHRVAAGGPHRRAGDPVLRPRGAEPQRLPPRQRPLPRREPADGRRERPLLPRRRVPVDDRHGRRVRLRRLAVHARAGRDRHAGGLRRLPDELLRPRAAAVPGLQHVPGRVGGPREDLRRARLRARHRRPRGRHRPAADRRRRAVRGRALRLRPGAARGARPRPGRRGRPDGRAGRAHRRGQVDHRQAARALLRPAGRAPSPSTGTTCAT